MSPDTDKRTPPLPPAASFLSHTRRVELQRGLIAAKLNDLGGRMAHRGQVAEWDRLVLEGLPDLRLPGDGEGWRHSYHLYVVQLPAARRDQALAACRVAGIPAGLLQPRPRAVVLQRGFEAVAQAGQVHDGTPHRTDGRSLQLPLPSPALHQGR